MWLIGACDVMSFYVMYQVSENMGGQGEPIQTQAVDDITQKVDQLSTVSYLITL